LISPSSQAEFDSRSFPTNSAHSPPQRGWVNVGSRGHAAKIGENHEIGVVGLNGSLMAHQHSCEFLGTLFLGRGCLFWNVMNWTYFGNILDIHYTLDILWMLSLRWVLGLFEKK
jgi:hypothetical protein